MSDITHYARARKWLDNPDNIISDEVRAELNAALAVSTAQRETEKTLNRLTDRISQFTAELTRVLANLGRDRFVRVDTDTFVNPALVTVVESDGDGATIHMSSTLGVATTHSAEETATRLAVGDLVSVEVEN